jgi:hypothetical protein
MAYVIQLLLFLTVGYLLSVKRLTVANVLALVFLTALAIDLLGLNQPEPTTTTTCQHWTTR